MLAVDKAALRTHTAKMPAAERTPQTLYDKVFQAHIVDEKLDGTILLYIDRHLVHEVTSPVGSYDDTEEIRLTALR